MSLRMPAVRSRRLPSAAIVRPSGSHVGTPKTEFGPAVIGETARVATSTTYRSGRQRMSWSRRRFEEKAIRVPSGDQAGSWSATGPSVRRVAAPVATSTSQRCSTLVVGEARRR